MQKLPPTRPRVPSLKKRANEDSTRPGITKIPKKNSYASTRDDDDVSIVETTAPRANRPGRQENINNKYFLVARVFLGMRRVVDITKHFFPGDFNCADFWSEAISKVQSAAESLGWNYSMVSAIATVSGHKLPWTDLGPGKGLVLGSTEVSIQFWNSALLYDPCFKSHAIKPWTVYRGRILHFSDRWNGA
jgi:hypothetical protein